MLLFTVVPVPGVAWLRIVSAAVIFAIWRRPWRLVDRTDISTKWLIVALGVVFVRFVTVWG